MDEVHRIVKMFRLDVNRSTFYAYGARGPLLENIKTTSVDQLIDSAIFYMKKTKVLNAVQSNRVQLGAALALRGGPDDIETAIKTIKNVQFKYFGMGLIARAQARNGRTFEALDYITKNTSAIGNAAFAANILYGHNLRNESVKQQLSWKIYMENHPWLFDRANAYADENN